MLPDEAGGVAGAIKLRKHLSGGPAHASGAAADVSVRIDDASAQAPEAPGARDDSLSPGTRHSQTGFIVAANQFLAVELAFSQKSA